MSHISNTDCLAKKILLPLKSQLMIAPDGFLRTICGDLPGLTASHTQASLKRRCSISAPGAHISSAGLSGFSQAPLSTFFNIIPSVQIPKIPDSCLDYFSFRDDNNPLPFFGPSVHPSPGGPSGALSLAVVHHGNVAGSPASFLDFPWGNVRELSSDQVVGIIGLRVIPSPSPKNCVMMSMS